MKKLKQMLVVVLIAAITMLSSCIKEEVASEVTALRNAQLGMITAKTEHQNLINAQQTIANELAAALNAHTVAMNALTMQAATADLELTLAWIAQELIEAEEALQIAELNLQEAIDELAEYLATQGLEEAANYLEDYEDSMGDYYNALYDILNQETNIAFLEATFAQEDYELVMEIIQRGLDSDIADLALMEDVLATLEAVAIDPATVEAELAAAVVYMQEVNNETAELIAEKDKHEIEVVAPAQDAWMEAVGGPSFFGHQFFDGIVPTYIDAAVDIIDYTEDIADYTEEIADITADNVALAAEAVLAEGILTTNTANYDAKKLLSDATEADVVTANADLAVTFYALEVAATDRQVDFNAWEAADDAKNVTANDLINAQWDVVNAENDLATAENDENIAEIAKQQAEDDKVADEPALLAAVATAEADVVTAEADLVIAQAAYDADPTVANLLLLHAAEANLEIAEEDLADAEANLEQLDIDIADATADLTDAQNARAAATVVLAAANTAEAAAQIADDAAAANLLTESDNLAAADATLQVFIDAHNESWDAWDIANIANMAAQGVTADAELLMDDAQGWYDDINDDIDDNLEDIDDLNIDIAEAQIELDIATATVADLQTAFDAVDLVALEAAFNAADKANDDLQDAIDANDDIIAAQDELIDILLNHLDNIDQAIADLEDDIDDIKVDINNAERALADNVIDEEEFTAMIAAETTLLEEFINLRDGYLAIADEYWALYLAAIGG